jgi:O-antigen ligase
MNFLLALQIIKVMPIGALTDGHILEQTAIRKIDRDIGYFRSDLAIFLGGAAWAIFCAKDLVTTYWTRVAIYGASFLTIFAVALTGGRIGMGGCMVVGVVLAGYKWRKILILGPIVTLIIISMVPSIKERFTQGFTENHNDTHQQTSPTDDGPSLNSVTSGRTIIWPDVINQIKERPFVGHGRRAIIRSGLSARLEENYNEPFPHPHNAYLELFLDNGFVLSLPILLFYFIMLKYAVQMLKVTKNSICHITGGIAIAFILSFLVGSIGQQSFYPTIGSVGLWCAMGILVRVRMEYFVSALQRTTQQANISWVQAEDMAMSITRQKNRHAA